MARGREAWLDGRRSGDERCRADPNEKVAAPMDDPRRGALRDATAFARVARTTTAREHRDATPRAAILRASGERVKGELR
jgi:hypothetical protein